MRQLVRKSWRKIYSAAARPLAGFYLRKDRHTRYGNMRLKVYTGVFHPGLFGSSRYMADWLQTQELKDKSVLEIGCGAGLISLAAAARGATVTAVDINEHAIRNTRENAAANGISLQVIQSDLFEGVPDTTFDLVLVNPPYYPAEPKDDYARAWYCGAAFEYFHRLFAQLHERKLDERCFLVLSEFCDLRSIVDAAAVYGIGLDEVHRRKVNGEWFRIYRSFGISTG